MGKTMNQQAIDVFLGQQKVCRLATVDRQGQPHVVPVWHILLDGELYVETSPRSKKGRNLQANQKVALVIDAGDSFEHYKGIMIQGIVEFVNDKRMLQRFRDAMAQRYFGTAEHPGYKYLVSGPDPLLMKVVPKKVVTWDYSQKKL
ncbi:pyridoxamine 5'-phosphate oxidase family protein [Candidatus Methylomirabilis sp.]|uniref:pyridoxamine 5'-phosphate oxidase family protein n=1 Tax=Candidatus Methylomirabilis sp. TaxID=2032687 RepID=UPI002A5BA99C|nr:pyridoxamine 5'-phosphate oxidase family protein [Candidatus Methylomirabilis sp.]